ncbi:MAG TPA: PQQ-dependent sugar dehydrogenase [Solirubrobacteraceae bacterium]|nr:PQQ-dependent sugar dehydrogenase [Solirubrobacteraceae bacterium]
MSRTRALPMLCLGSLIAVVLASSCSSSSSAGTGAGASASTTVGAGQADAPNASSSRAAASSPHTARAGTRLVRVGSFAQPTYVAGPPGDRRRVFVVEQAGRIQLVLDGRKLAAPFLDITAKVGVDQGERGLLSVAFAPDYASSGVFYVYYTDHNGDIQIERRQRSASNPNMADADMAQRVLSIPHHLYANHNGGQLQFGPDGDLYVGVGDGGSANDPLDNGENTGVLLGKLLRIAPKPGGGYAIPAGNPFAARRGARPEIWAYGLRNPWRYSFDRSTGALVIGDVGQDQQEEIDFAAAGAAGGANYGWSIFEGDRRNKPGAAAHAVAPVLVTRHSDGNCAIIGGYVVRDRALRALYGRYLYSDSCNPRLRTVRLSPGHARGDHAIGLSVKDISSFGQDTSGRIYAASLDGPVYRLAAK